MDIQANHVSQLLYAKKEFVNKSNLLLQKIKYGENIDCCIDIMFLASRLIKKLDCCCFNDKPIFKEEALAELTLDRPYEPYLAGTFFAIIVNGVQKNSITITSSSTETDVIIDLLESINMSGVLNGTVITATGFSDTVSISIVIDEGSGGIVVPFTLTVEGKSNTSKCHNCITDDDLKKAYSALTILLSK